MCNMCDANASSLIAKEQWENIDEGWLRKAGLELQVEGYEDPNNTPFIQKEEHGVNMKEQDLPISYSGGKTLSFTIK